MTALFFKKKALLPQEDSLFPPGHFYSPIVDRADMRAREQALWRVPEVLAGIDLNSASHTEILTQWFPQFIKDYDYPDKGDPHAPQGFFNHNDQFSWLDARALFVFLRKLRPARVIEVGSGYSSLMIADVNTRFLQGACEFTCIEPYPRAFLKSGIKGVSKLIEKRVEELSLDVFSSLESGDILFIDSSHVAKTGSDVLYLFFEVLPRLKPGVMVHVHDIFLPAEYPKEWVIDQGRNWNEQYLLRALLMFSTRFKVRFGCNYAAIAHGPEVVAALAREDGQGMAGGSVWIEVQA
jgi:Methyltransferase domain